MEVKLTSTDSIDKIGIMLTIFILVLVS